MTLHIPPMCSALPEEVAEDGFSPTLPMPQLVGHGCFACGTANPGGLGMTFSRQGDRVVSRVTLRREHMGWDRIAHGGLVATVLDEIMAHAVIALLRRFFVTRRISLTYRRPVPLDVPLRAEGFLTERDTPRGCRTGGRLLDDADVLLAEAEAEMAYVSRERLHMVSPPLCEEMEQLFAAMTTLDAHFAK